MTTATYSIHPTPIGDALLVHTSDGLVALQIVGGDVEGDVEGDSDGELAGIARALGELPLRDDEAAASLCAQLDEYFAGDRRDFEVELDWRFVRGFTRAALEAARQIPYGETASYGEVAIVAGSPRAHRAVGTACATTPFSIVVPVHRVVRADGSVGEYGRHPEMKRFLLGLEQKVRAAAPV